VKTYRRSARPAAARTPSTPPHRASATARCHGLRTGPSVSLALHSGPAPLAEALCGGVPLGTPPPRAPVFLVLSYGTRVSLPTRYRATVAIAMRLSRERPARAPRAPAVLVKAQLWPLLALAARCKGRGRFAPPPCTPTPARSAARLRRYVAIAGVAGWQRGRWCAPLGTPRLACRSHAAPAAPLVTPGKVSKTRTAGPDRWPAVVTVRDHRLLRLYRAVILHSPSQCFKYLLGSGGGAPRLPYSVGSRLKIHPELLTLAP